MLNPAHIFTTLDQIDNEAPSYSLNRKQANRRVFWVLACVCVSLLLIHYMKYFSSLTSTLNLFSTWRGHDSQYLYRVLQRSDYMHLVSYLWWTAWHVIGYVLLPYIVIKKILRISFIDMGWRWGETHHHWRAYVLLLTPILFFIFLVSFRSDFLQHYPFYKDAGRSWLDFISWEVLYLTQFICLEFFFRGFILNALRPAIGANAIWVMCVPYLMIHFPKLWLEATGAIFFGLFLGLLALRSRSIWGGFLVHAGVAVTMDIASLLQQNQLPSNLLP